MAGEDYRATFASKSDDELAALEKDATLSAEAWAALEGERSRRQSARQSSGARESTAPDSMSRGAPRNPPPPPPRGMSVDDPRIEGAKRDLASLLIPGESVEATAVQRRLFALTHRRVLVAATTGRFIGMFRGLLGGYTPVDVRWQDLHDASLREGIFGADLTITSAVTDDMASANTPGRSMVFQGLRKDEAQRVYRVCQTEEQSWREKRRVRDLSELRAKSGGIQIGAQGGGGLAGVTGGSSGDDPATRLKHAKEMRDGGLITDSEYEAIKARIVEGL
jgi:hypothetical protein